MSISSISPGGVNSTQMFQNMNDRFQATDVDKSGSLSKAEVTTALETKGLDPAKADRIFQRMDVNGDGQITMQEQRDQMKALQDRIEKFTNMMSTGEENGFDPLQNLLEAMQSDTEDSSQQGKLNALLEKMKSGQFSDQDVTASINAFNSILPPISIKV